MLTFTLPAERHEADVRSFYREIAQAGDTCIGCGSAGDFAVWRAEMRNRHTGTDLPDGYVLDVFAAAKRYVRANGNASQWRDEYPDRSIVTYDIACGSSYVMLENGEIVGTFALFLGEDESYRVIEDGAWHLDQPYGTIHRLASNGKARGVSKACFDFCTAQIGYLRADTHADNRPMQRLLEAYGFRRCGVIHGAVNGGKRIAYDCIAHI